MIGIILGVVGLAGGGGFIALVAKFGLKVVLGKAGGLFKAMPRWGWVALAVVALLIVGTIWHGRKEAAHDKALTAQVTAQVNAAWTKRFDHMLAQADDVRRRAEAASAKISTKWKEHNDAQIRDHAAVAGDLRLRGPGRAAFAGCRPVDHPGLSSPASEPGGPAGAGSAAAGQMPAGDRLAGLPGGARDAFAVVPWSWLVDQAQRADDSRSEVITWRNWYADQLAVWEAMRRKGASSNVR